MSENINIPDYIKGSSREKEYIDQYNRLEELRAKYKEYACTNGAILNLATPKSNLVKQMNKKNVKKKHEVAKLLTINKLVQSNKSKLNAIKRQAKNGTGAIMPKFGILHDHVDEVIDMFANFMTKVEITSYAEKEWNLDVKYHDINNFYQKYKSDIERAKSSKIKSWDDMPLAEKRGRLEKLEYLYNSVVLEMEKAQPKDKIFYARELRGIIDQVRKEIEGDKISFDINGKIDIDISLHKSISERDNKLIVLQMVLAKVGINQRVNPLYLMYRLQNSWYAKQTGMSANNSEGIGDSIYPSDINYNIEEMHGKFLKESTVIVDAEIIESDDTKVSERTRLAKQKLLEILSKTK